MPNTHFNNRLRQIILLGLIIFLTIVFASQLHILLPGTLGGITFYILTRKWYHTITEQKKWKKGLAALLFIIAGLIIIAIPVYFSIKIISPKIKSLINNQHEVLLGLQALSEKMENYIGAKLFTPESTK